MRARARHLQPGGRSRLARPGPPRPDAAGGRGS
jgi:hypothetical protein